MRNEQETRRKSLTTLSLQAVQSGKSQTLYLVSAQALDEGVCLLHTSIHDHGDAHGQASQDLLVLRLLGVAHHVLDSLGRLGAQHDQTQSEARRLA